MARTTRCVGALVGVIAAIGAAAFSPSASAAVLTSYSQDGDSGSLQVTTSTSVGVSGTITGLYGLPTITPIASGWKLEYTPSAAFLAAANNAGGDQTELLSAKLDFTVGFSDAIPLTVNVFENGIFNHIGDGTVQVFGGGTLTEAQHTVPAEDPITNSGLTATFNNTTGGWSAYDQIGGLHGSYTKYSVSIDNDLIARALANPAPGWALIAKKNFTIYLTFDGSSGGLPPIPEPASLGILALGGLALLSRRRRV